LRPANYMYSYMKFVCRNKFTHRHSNITSSFIPGI
jgi:hypothetical protein